MNKAKVVTLCGSSRFVDVMAVCAWLLERDEKAITMGLHLLPRWYFSSDIQAKKLIVSDHLAEFEGVAEAMDQLHLHKIDLSDEIFVVNINDYIGDSTRREIAYAKSISKKIRWFTDDIIGKKVLTILGIKSE